MPPLAWPKYFDIYRNMEIDDRSRISLLALAALAQEHRLGAFRLLVQAGKQGLAAGLLADRLGLPASSLSFHLSQLAHARLVDQRREGRSIIYSANFSAMNGLIAFLTENCCGDGDCTVSAAPICES